VVYQYTNLLAFLRLKAFFFFSGSGAESDCSASSDSSLPHHLLSCCSLEQKRGEKRELSLGSEMLWRKRDALEEEGEK